MTEDFSTSHPVPSVPHHPAIQLPVSQGLLCRLQECGRALRAGDWRENTRVPLTVQEAPLSISLRPKSASLKEFRTQIPGWSLKHRGTFLYF